MTMDRRGTKPPHECDPMTRAQLDELERRLTPVIARFLEEPVDDTTVAIMCTPVHDDPDGASIMRFEVKVRGEPISEEREQKLAKLLCSESEPNIVKAKPGPVY